MFSNYLKAQTEESSQDFYRQKALKYRRKYLELIGGMTANFTEKYHLLDEEHRKIYIVGAINAKLNEIILEVLVNQRTHFSKSTVPTHTTKRKNLNKLLYLYWPFESDRTEKKVDYFINTLKEISTPTFKETLVLIVTKGFNYLETKIRHP